MEEREREPGARQAGIAVVAEAERASEEMVRRAREEAERVLADAAERARMIRESALEAGPSEEAGRVQAETAEERRRVSERAKAQIGELCRVGESHESDAVRHVLAILLGEG